MSSLFRTEALHYRQDRLHGELILLVPWASRALTALLLLAVVLLAGLLVSVDYARKETVTGYLVSSRGTARVYAPASGTVVELHVQEGDPVKVGDPLLGIRHERSGAGGSSSQVEILAALAEQVAEQRRWLAIDSQRVAARQQALQQEVQALDQQLAALHLRQRRQQSLTQLVEAELTDLQRLQQQGVATASMLRDKQQELLLEQRDSAELAQEIALLSGQRQARQVESQTIELERQQAHSERQLQLLALREQQARIEGERFTLLTAAVDGQVAALYASVGEDVGPDEPQLAILPAGGELLAELFVPTRASGFVRPGQEARLLYEAFPYQRFGSFAGTVESITTTIIPPEDLPGPVLVNEPVYRVRVRLAAQHIDAQGRRLALQAGMLLQANLILERRPLLAWLLAPFGAVWGST